MAIEQDVHAKAIFNDLGLLLDAILLGILQHPEIQDAGEVDLWWWLSGIIIGMYAGTILLEMSDNTSISTGPRLLAVSTR